MQAIPAARLGDAGHAANIADSTSDLEIDGKTVGRIQGRWGDVCEARRVYRVTLFGL